MLILIICHIKSLNRSIYRDWNMSAAKNNIAGDEMDNCEGPIVKKNHKDEFADLADPPLLHKDFIQMKESKDVLTHNF